MQSGRRRPLESYNLQPELRKAPNFKSNENFALKFEPVFVMFSPAPYTVKTASLVGTRVLHVEHGKKQETFWLGFGVNGS